MSYIYQVEVNSYLSDEEIKSNDLCRCCLSTRNILALSNDSFVYIVPLEKPNELIPVNLTSNPLSNSPCLDLVWSYDGLYLLNVTKSGVCNLYNINTNLLNSVELVFTFQINKNDVACAKPFNKLPKVIIKHNYNLYLKYFKLNHKLCLNGDKREALNYLEKYYYNQSLSCLRHLGNSFSNGFVLLTKCGMVHLLVTDFNSVKNKYQKYDYDMKLKEIFKNQQENIMDFESQVDDQSTEDNEQIMFDLGDFSYETDGSILVAYSNFEITSPVYLYKVTIKLESEIIGLIEGNSELISIINLNESCGLKSSILFSSINSARFLAVSTNQNSIQFWENSNNKRRWNLANNFQSQTNIININMPKSKDIFKEEKSYILVSYENGTIGYINSDTYTQDYFLQTLPARKNKSFEYTIALDQSFTGSIGAGITNNASLITFRRFISPSDFPIKNQKLLLDYYEYCLITGYDYWDLLISTNPKMIENLISLIEKRYFNQSISLKKAYFSRVYSLIYSLSRRSTIDTVSDYKALDILTKLVLNRCLINISNSIQFTLNVDSIVSTAPSYVNTSIQPSPINTSILNSNIDVLSINPSLMTTNFNQIPFNTNLNEYLSDVLNLDCELVLNEIVQSILSRKFASVTLSHQIKHIFQWIVDISLYLITETVLNKSQNKSFYTASLLNDYWFLNELRKSLIYLKLIQTVSQTNATNNLINSSLPILPFKSSFSNQAQQKDYISDLFNLISKLINRNNSGETNALQDTLTSQCLAVQNDLITKSRFEEKFFNLKQTWFGSSRTSWLKTYQFPVDYLFEIEKSKDSYPLFDIIRLVEFSRSNLTKQCFRCGNYTESATNSTTNNNNNNSNNNTPISQNNSSTLSSNLSPKLGNANLQDLASDKCVCGGLWVLSSLLQ